MNKTNPLVPILALISLAFLIAVGGGTLATPAHGAPGTLPNLQLPPNFQADLYVSGLNVPRFVSFSPDGVLYVADMGSGKVAALPDRNHDGVPDSTITIASG